MSLNPLKTNNFIDSCAFDPKYEPEDSASKSILDLCDQGILRLIVAHSIEKEMEHPNTPVLVKNIASMQISTIDVQCTSNEIEILERIQKVLAGNGKMENVKQDAWHIFEAQKYGSYFITTDKRILSRATQLAKDFNVQVLRPSEFLELVNQRLKQ